MKIRLNQQRNRGWILWAFLVVVAGAVVLCKVLCNMASQMQPVAPPPPPADTNEPFKTNNIGTNPPVDIAVWVPINMGNTPVPANPMVVNFSFGLDTNGQMASRMVSVAKLDTSESGQSQADYNALAAQWLHDWGIGITYGVSSGNPTANYGVAQWLPAPQWGPGWSQWVLVPIQTYPPIWSFDPGTMTLTVNEAQQANPTPYVAMLQRLDENMQNPVNLNTNTVTAGQTLMFIDANAPATQAFYRVMFHQK